MQLSNRIGIVQCVLQNAEQNNRKENRNSEGPPGSIWSLPRSSCLGVPRTTQDDSWSLTYQWGYPCLTLVINLVPCLYFCIVSHRPCVVCAHGALVAEGAEGCERSSPTPTACVFMMLFRALPSEVCVWLMRPRVLDQGFMEKFTWKKAGSLSWAGANYLFRPRMFLVSQVKIFDTVMIS